MVNSASIVLVAVLCTLANAKPKLDRDLAEIDSVFPEEECVMQGGMCVKATDCENPTAIKGLCPRQRSKGIECCYGISTKETRCQLRGGGCVSRGYCPPHLIFHDASDCSQGHECCIFNR